MKRSVVSLLICIGCLVISGCRMFKHGIIHPHSEVTEPIFCLYDGRFHSEDVKPLLIGKIKVRQAGVFNHERMEWSKWLEQKPLSKGPFQEVWHIEYAPDSSDPPEKPFSCIIYGKVPPGYEELTAALPLIPERVYSALILDINEEFPMSWIPFIIRADSQGRPTHLEYESDMSNVQVITPQ